ncbi:TPA: hypothetical protein NIJ58_004621 [Pseudomonas aeruginosa]|nr:hypothetical protein [Pseudomonas aeruginosa]
MNKANECTCPSGDGSLVHPCPAHPAVEQAGGDERAAFEAAFAAMGRPVCRADYDQDAYGTPFDDGGWTGWQARAALAQPSPAPELAERGTQHRFSTTEQTCRHDFAGVWWNDNGETKTGKECRECGFFIADIAEAPELERPEVAGYLATAEHPKHGQPHKAFNYFKDQHDAQVAHWRERGCTVTEDRLMTVSQHDRIVGALRAKADQLREALEWRKENQAGQRELLRSVKAERDAALARVAELEKQEPVGEVRESGGTLTAVIVRHSYATKLPVGTKLYAAPVAQAQHSGPEEFSFEYRHPNGESHTVTVSRDQVISEMPDFLLEALCSKFCNCEPVGETNVVECCCDEYAEEFKLLAAAPGKEVPQAWLDVQAERRRQVEVEGYHGFRDNHYISYELSKAARAYIEVSWHALSGGLPCKKPESWPWMAGFKWSDGRTMLVKACALALAEIERLDRAAATQGGPSDA